MSIVTMRICEEHAKHFARVEELTLPSFPALPCQFQDKPGQPLCGKPSAHTYRIGQIAAGLLKDDPHNIHQSDTDIHDKSLGGVGAVLCGPPLTFKPGVCMPLPYVASLTQPGVPAVVSAVQLKLSAAETSDASAAIQADLLWKFSRGDWHGVADAACDLRVLEAQEAKRG